MIYQKTHIRYSENQVYKLLFWFAIFIEPGLCSPDGRRSHAYGQVVHQVSYCILGLMQRPCTGWVGGNGLSLPWLYGSMMSLCLWPLFLVWTRNAKQCSFTLFCISGLDQKHGKGYEGGTFSEFDSKIQSTRYTASKNHVKERSLPPTQTVQWRHLHFQHPSSIIEIWFIVFSR